MKHVLLVFALGMALLLSGCVVAVRSAPQYSGHDTYYGNREVVPSHTTVYREHHQYNEHRVPSAPSTTVHIERRIVIQPRPDWEYHRDSRRHDRQYDRRYDRQKNYGRCMNAPYWHKNHNKYCH